MQKKFCHWLVFFFIFLPIFPPEFLFCSDQRTVPVDIYLIFDGSSAIENKKDAASQWVCDAIVDGLLQEGDTLTLWIAAEKAEKVFSGTIDDPGRKESIKNLIRSITGSGTYANYAGALREAASLQLTKGERAIPYTLLIAGSTTVMFLPDSPENASGIRGSETLGYLRYSRMEEFSGWRVMTAVLEMDRQIQQAAAAYMSSQ
jgi:hypothetical protein